MGQNNSSFKPEHIKALNAFDPRVEHLKKELINLVERHHSHRGPSREDPLRKCAICADSLAAFHQHVAIFHTELRYYTMKNAEKHGLHLTEAEMMHAEQLTEHANIVLGQIKHLIESETEHELLPAGHHHHDEHSAPPKSIAYVQPSNHHVHEQHHGQSKPTSASSNEPLSPTGQSEAGDVFDPEDVFSSTGTAELDNKNDPSGLAPTRETSEADCYIPGANETPENDFGLDNDLLDGNATPLNRKSNRSTFAVTSIDEDEGTMLPDMHSRSSSMASDIIPAKTTGHRITQSFADTAPTSIGFDANDLENRLSRVSSNSHTRHAPQPSYVDPEMNDAAMQTSLDADKLTDRLSRVSFAPSTGPHHSRVFGSMASGMEPIEEVAKGDSTPRGDQRHSTSGYDLHRGPTGSRHSNSMEVQDDDVRQGSTDGRMNTRDHHQTTQPEGRVSTTSSHLSAAFNQDSRASSAISTGTQHSLNELNKMAEVESHHRSARPASQDQSQFRESQRCRSESMDRHAQDSMMSQRGSYATLESLPDWENERGGQEDSGDSFHASGVRDSMLTAKCHKGYTQTTSPEGTMDEALFLRSGSSGDSKYSSTISEDGEQDEDEDDKGEEEEEEEEEGNVIEIDLQDLAKQFGNRKQRMETDGSRFSTLDSESSSYGSSSGSFDSDTKAHRLSGAPHAQAHRAIEDRHSKHLSKVDIERGAFLGDEEQRSPDAVRSLTAIYPKPVAEPHKMPSKPVWQS